MKKAKYIIILIFLFLLIPFQACAQNWYKMFTNGGRTYYLYKKVNKVSHYRYSYTAWVKITYDTQAARADRKGNRKYTPFEEKILYAFSDDWSKIGTIQYALYRKNGDVIDSDDYSDYVEMKNIIPETVGESYAKWAKYYRPLTQQEISQNNAKARTEAINRGFIELPYSNGVLYKILKEGTGPIVNENQLVKVIYTAYHSDGREYDDSEGKTITFNLQHTISGFASAVKNMSVGSKWSILIPSSEGFGVEGLEGVISPNEDLFFTIELVGLENK